MKEVYELNEENEKVLSRNNDDKKGNISMVT